MSFEHARQEEERYNDWVYVVSQAVNVATARAGLYALEKGFKINGNREDRTGDFLVGLLTLPRLPDVTLHSASGIG